MVRHSTAVQLFREGQGVEVGSSDAQCTVPSEGFLHMALGMGEKETHSLEGTDLRARFGGPINWRTASSRPRSSPHALARKAAETMNIGWDPR
jgi:hypothetical protein